MPFCTVASMPQKFGQIAQFDLMRRIAGPAASAACLAAYAAAAIAGNWLSRPASPPAAPMPWRNVRRLDRMGIPRLVGSGATDLETLRGNSPRRRDLDQTATHIDASGARRRAITVAT
jgi:hypothetical protein